MQRRDGAQRLVDSNTEMGQGVRRRAFMVSSLALVVILVLAASASAAPVVTSAHIEVDASGASGSSGQLIAGDAVVITWDNSSAGDDNSDVTQTSQVVFDVFGITSLQADSVAAGIFSLTYFVTQGSGDLNDVSPGVTVASPGGTTGPVYGLETVDIDGNPPVVTPARILVDFSGASGLGGTFHPGDTIVVSWDNSSAGDHNTDVVNTTQVEFDLFGLQTVSPYSVAGGVFSRSYTFSPGDPDFTHAGVTVTAIDDAGNVTGPVHGLDLVSFSSNPAPSVPALSPLYLTLATFVLLWAGASLLRHGSLGS